MIFFICILKWICYFFLVESKNLNRIILPIAFISMILIYGSTFIAAKEAVQVFSATQVAAFRIIVAFLVLQLIALFRGRPNVLPKNIMIESWCSGLLLQAIPFTLFAWGMKFVSPGMGGILEATIPIFTYFFAVMILGYRPENNRQTLGALWFGMIGIVLLF